MVWHEAGSLSACSALVELLDEPVLSYELYIIDCLCRLFAQLTFVGSDRAEFHIMQFIKMPSKGDKVSRSTGKNAKRDSILPLDLLKGTDSDVKSYLASCLRAVYVRALLLHLTIPTTVYYYHSLLPLPLGLPCFLESAGFFP